MTTVELQPVQQNIVTVNPEQREEVVRNLLGVDYDHAVRNGELDIFYTDYSNPGKLSDGLIHTLGGELRFANSTGFPLSGGFHHEPSVEAVWPGPDVNGQYPTYAVEDPSGFRHHPMAPYKAEAVIGGLSRLTPRYFKQPGTSQSGVLLVPIESSFYPKEYDPYAVIKAINIAYHNRDTASETIASIQNDPRIKSRGQVPLLDGTPMDIKFVLDFETEKIITAIPEVPAYDKQMHLTDDEMWHLLTTPTMATKA